MSMNIKKGDKVVVLNTRRQKDKNGKPKTVTGKVLAVIPEKDYFLMCAAAIRVIAHPW